VRSGRQAFEIVLAEPLSPEVRADLAVTVAGTQVALPFSARREFTDGAVPPTTFDRLGMPHCESPFMEAILTRDRVPPDKAALMREFSAKGLLKFPIRDPDFDRLASTIVETLRDRYQGQRRIQDAWRFNAAVRQLACLPEVLSLLEFLYGRAPIPMQTLNFPVGTEQATHTDSLHFNSLPPRFMCGVWVALEPITTRNGPLHYYPGSHRFPVIGLDDLGLLADAERWSENYERHQDVLRALIKVHDLKKEVVMVERGEAVIWAANLCHGGEPIADPGSTRHSQVTHYYFEHCAYYHPMGSNLFLGRLCRPDRRDIRTGEPITPVFGPGKIPVDIPIGDDARTAGAPPIEPSRLDRLRNRVARLLGRAPGRESSHA
jgi:hypothetical protein